MKAWFYSLQTRERWLVSVGAVVVLAIVLWSGVIRPLATRSTALRATVQTKQQLLLDVGRVADPGATSDNPVRGGEQTLVVIVSETASTYGLESPRTRANGPSGIDVTFQGAPFDSLVAWLVALHSGYGVEVEAASFSSAREPGLVNGQVSLHRL